MLDRLFFAHPRSVDEGYLDHQRTAFGFAGALLLAAAACTAHGLCPALCEKTGSTMVRRALRADGDAPADGAGADRGDGFRLRYLKRQS